MDSSYREAVCKERALGPAGTCTKKTTSALIATHKEAYYCPACNAATHANDYHAHVECSEQHIMDMREKGYQTIEGALIKLYNKTADGRERAAEAAVRQGATPTQDWKGAHKAHEAGTHTREGHCYDKYPRACEAGLIPFGTGSDDARNAAGATDFAFRGSLTNDTVRTLGAALQRAKKGKPKKDRPQSAAKAKATEGEGDGINELRAAVLDAAINNQIIASAVLTHNAKKLKIKHKTDDKRNKKQAVRTEGTRCKGARCAIRMRSEGQMPNVTPNASGHCQSCEQREAAVKHATDFEQDIMANEGEQWRWQLGRLATANDMATPKAIEQALTRVKSAGTTKHMPRVKGNEEKVGLRGNYAARDVAESANVRIRHRILTGTCWTTEQQKKRRDNANQLCTCTHAASHKQEWWCTACNKLRPITGKDGLPLEANSTEGGCCKGCEQEKSEGKWKKGRSKSEQALKMCKACGDKACARHSSNRLICGACQVRATMRKEGTNDRWDRMKKSGTGNAASQMQMRKKIKKEALAAGALSGDARTARTESRRTARTQIRTKHPGSTHQEQPPHWYTSATEQDTIRNIWAGRRDDTAQCAGGTRSAGFAITKRDIWSLQAGQMGNDSVVGALVQMAAKQHGKRQAHAVDPLRTGQLRRDAARGVTTPAVGRADRQAGRDTNKRYWYYPINQPEERHWVLWAVDRADATATFYDSMNGSGDKEWEAVRRHITAVTPGLSESTTWTRRDRAMPQQRGGAGLMCAIRCGVHAMADIIERLEDEMPPQALPSMRAEHEDEMRMAMANAVYTGILPRPWLKTTENKKHTRTAQPE
jgi:hypothetical protein